MELLRKRACVLFLSCGLVALAAIGISNSDARAQSAGADRTSSQQAPRDVLPPSPPAFNGRIGRIAQDSQPDWPVRPAAPAGAPNVLLILTDDVGFGASSTFGGPVPTPTLDRLARGGVRFNRFHTTAMCSPTRAALLTGRNHHNVGFGVVSEMASGFPGYNSVIPRSAGSLAEILRQNGYSTAMFGKHHNVPNLERGAAGPFDQWPTGLGFEYFYGFVGAETNQWFPALVEGVTSVEPNYDARPIHLDVDLADHAIAWIRRHNVVAPAKPMFIYYATGTPHAPHHAPPEWIGRFRGRFDQGWDRVRAETFARQKRLGVTPRDALLTPRTPGIAAWSSLSPDQRRIYARMMEVYAGTLAHTDYQIGRIIDTLEQSGELENTLIIFIQGDNGASQEGTMQGNTAEYAVNANNVEESTPYQLSILDALGGPMTYNHYPVGWAWAMNTPFPWAKQVASHLGGTRNGMVLSWPRHIRRPGGMRAQFGHVVDIAPTVLEAAGVRAPSILNGIAQTPFDGVSLLYALNAPTAPERHRSQYFELMGNRAIYQDGWMASTMPRRPPWTMVGGSTQNPAEDYEWELYDLNRDFSQAINLAPQESGRLRALQQAWWREAERNNVLPLDDRFLDRPRLARTEDQTEFHYRADDTRIPPPLAPPMEARSYSLIAELVVPAGGGEGVLATLGGRFGGWGLFVVEGKPHFVYALSNQERDHWTIAAPTPLSPGRHTIRFDYNYDGGGRGNGADGVLSVDGRVVARGRIARTARLGLTLDEFFDVGSDSGTPVSESYADRMPFRYSGELRELRVQLR